MTKISKKSAYPVKNPVVGDYFVGTDSENNNKTVSFGFEYAANLINRINGSLIINYMFKTDVNIPLAVLTQGHFLSQDNNTDINTVTKLYVNKTNFQEDDLSDLFLFIKENASDYYFKLQNSENLINAVYFNISSIVAYSEYFEFNIEIDKTNPSLTTLVDSNIYFFTFEIKSNITKTSDLENDGEDGSSPFVTEASISIKENKSEKGQANGYVPLNEFTKIASTYLNIVNDLITGGTTSLLSAEQGKQVQLQIDAINSILFSDNVNLDTIQEIVDAIESLQGYLDTILVNDLTTGGTTKALTAEMGKTLKGLIDALTTIVSDLQADVTAIDSRLTILENVSPPAPKTELAGQAFVAWSGTGLKYFVNYPIYYIEGVSYPSGSGDITLDSTSSMTTGQKRYDLIILDENGINKITGTPDENPVLPTIDSDIQIVISNVLLNAGDVIPSDNTVIYEQIFNDNEEWAVSQQGALTVNPNYTAITAFKGTKSLYITAFGNGTDYVRFTYLGTKLLTDYTLLTFRLYLPSDVASDGDLDTSFLYNGADSTKMVTIRSGLYGYNSSLKNTWQSIMIPISNYEILNININQFVFRRSSSRKRTYIIDDIALVGANVISSPTKQKAVTTFVTDNGVASASKEDDTINIYGSNGVETSAFGKSIFIDVSNIETLYHKLAWATAGDISITGTTATSSAGVFEEDMVGARISIGSQHFVISSYSSASSVQVALAATGTVTGPNGSWGVYNRAVEISNTGLNLYGTSSPVPATIYSESTMILPNLVTTIGSLIGILPGSVQMTSGVPLVWRSGDLSTDASRDVGLRRNAAGVLEIFDGITAGQYRDMVVRHISGVTATAPEHYVPLAQMEDADADVLQDSKDYTDAGLALKLNTADYNDRYKGKYTSLANLETAHPTANAGDYAQVDTGSGSDVVNYNWDAEEGWVIGSSSGSGATNTDALPEGSSNLYFTTARVLATALSGLSAASGTFTSSDTVLTAFGKIKYLIDNIATTYQAILTDVNFGAFINGLTAKTTPVDADYDIIMDSADSNKLKKVSWVNRKATLKAYFDGFYLVPQITITTTTSITTDTVGTVSGLSQKGRNTIIDNGVNAINITVNGGTGFCASYVKHGTGTITFVQGSGRTLVQVDGTASLNGAVGSTATIASVGTTDYLRISNA